MPRAAGIPNRNYPGISLLDALVIARGIDEHASGKPMNRLLLADVLETTPSSSTFKSQLSASRQYGLTVGTEKADRIELTTLGEQATEEARGSRDAALRRAAMTPEPFRLFFREYDGKRIPSPVVLRKWLEENAGVPAAHSEHAGELLIRNARDVGLLKTIKGSDYVILEERDAESEEVDEPQALPKDGANEVEERVIDTAPNGKAPPRSGKVFIGHGKNRKPVEQLKSMLGTLGVQVGVAIDESHQGRPISQKVADVMQECTSACFIFTADESYKSDDGIEHWRPSDNAVYELGAASVLYGRRIVIFKEAGVDFASDFSDLGYISFEKDRLDAKMGDLLKELVSFGILEIRAASAT